MSSVILITSFLAILSSGVMALLPMEQSMNADIMADVMDLRRKIMKHQMLLASIRGIKGGNQILPAAAIGMRDFFPLLGGAFPPQASGTSGSQIGGSMPEVPPSFQNLGIANQGTAPQKNTGKPSKKNSSIKNIDQSSGTVSSPTPEAINTMISSSNNQFSMADLLKNGPIGGSSNNPMVPPVNTNLQIKGSSRTPKGQSVSGQGKGTKPVKNPTKAGASQISAPSGNAGQPAMPFPQQSSLSAFRKFYIQQELCSETPSRLTTMCSTTLDCRHNMQCFSGRCCASSHIHAEILDNMLEQPGMRL
ncbi:uncharacterized protein LOC117340782 [Pecten maximus]|uniref:uncharacterized protein LOC117340782 n=1 Tax=Pecten maximus TaxID=6579 RepID=UPI00145806B0|nr:uncharacterized protein LOC117340782 [Pecten maximus]